MNIISTIEKLIQQKTKVARYWGTHADGSHRCKSYATKAVDTVFKKLSAQELKKLSPEVKKFMRDYLADGWYYMKYYEKRNAIND